MLRLRTYKNGKPTGPAVITCPRNAFDYALNLLFGGVKGDSCTIEPYNSSAPFNIVCEWDKRNVCVDLGKVMVMGLYARYDNQPKKLKKELKRFKRVYASFREGYLQFLR